MPYTIMNENNEVPYFNTDDEYYDTPTTYFLSFDPIDKLPAPLWTSNSKESLEIMISTGGDDHDPTRPQLFGIDEHTYRIVEVSHTFTELP